MEPTFHPACAVGVPGTAGAGGLHRGRFRIEVGEDLLDHHRVFDSGR
jgi:hypothetical protein